MALRIKDRVKQRAPFRDRRIILVRITAAGLSFLQELDQPVARFHRRTLGHLGERRLRTLSRPLEEAGEV